MFRGTKATNRQMSQRYKVVLKVAVIVAVERELAARQKRDRVQIADVGASDLRKPLLVVIRTFAFVNQAFEVFEGS